MNLQSINCFCVLCPCSKPKDTFPSVHWGRNCPSIMSTSSEGKNMSKKVPREPPTFWNWISQLTLKQGISHKSSVTDSKGSRRLQVNLLSCPCPGLAQVPYLFLQEHACHWSESTLWHWGSSPAASHHGTEELWYWWTQAGKWRCPW